MLDPVDGTKSFITGVPLWGTLIRAAARGQPVLGCIHQPVLDQLMIGDGTVTTLNGAPVRCDRPRRSRKRHCSRAILHPAKYQNGAAFETLAKRTRSCAPGRLLRYLLLASGWADICSIHREPLDIAAVYRSSAAPAEHHDWKGGAAYQRSPPSLRDTGAACASRRGVEGVANLFLGAVAGAAAPPASRFAFISIAKSFAICCTFASRP